MKVKTQAALEVVGAVLAGIVGAELLIRAVEYFGFMKVCAGAIMGVMLMFIYIVYKWRCYEIAEDRRLLEQTYATKE